MNTCKRCGGVIRTAGAYWDVLPTCGCGPLADPLPSPSAWKGGTGGTFLEDPWKVQEGKRAFEAETREALERKFLDAYRELKEFEKGVDIDVDVHYHHYDLLEQKVDEAWTALENFNRSML